MNAVLWIAGDWVAAAQVGVCIALVVIVAALVEINRRRAQRDGGK